MKRISNKEQEKPRQYRPHKLHDLRLTPDGLRVVCAGPDNDPDRRPHAGDAGEVRQ